MINIDIVILHLTTKSIDRVISSSTEDGYDFFLMLQLFF